MGKSNPIAGIKDFIDSKIKEGFKPPVIYINKPIYDLMLKRTGCNNCEELLLAYRKEYPLQSEFTITILE